MATIVLSTVGSLFGPIGQIVGTLAGSVIDNAIFAPKDYEGARLKELTVSGSSYGTPIARLYGKMRVPGTIVWSTDLTEHRDKQSNGKGQPKTVTYSYSVSFAVALSSRPIDGVGRIWADGNLLRGASGDLKSGGSLRIYQGHADQARDPLLEAVLGDQCPAFRGCSYAVFEDLDLTDFGNRIPSLSFEILAGDASRLVGDMLKIREIGADDGARFPELAGFGHESGSLREVAQLVDRLHPLAPRLDQNGLHFSSATALKGEPVALPPAAAWDDGDFGKQVGQARVRLAQHQSSFSALRYYDPARDYQPGLQHASNSDEGSRTFQFPGALTAGDAQKLARLANTRSAVNQDTLSWRCAELDPEIGPGSLVTAPGVPGLWLVSAWEWRERGVELELQRYRAASSDQAPADPGRAWIPRDRPARSTILQAFETPWDGNGGASQRRAYFAAGAAEGLWPGCAFYSVRGTAVDALGQSTASRAAIGSLATPLAKSRGLRFEPKASFELRLVDESAELESTDLPGLAQGKNRLFVGGEILQFLLAEPMGEGRWNLSGLLRGRAATEFEALAGHEAGTFCALLDENLVPIADRSLSAATGQYAAIGPWDEDPVIADLENAGASLRPPNPVHGRFMIAGDGSARLTWKRRARGQWRWLDDVDQPLVEESEAYEVGIGPVDAPFARWVTALPRLELSPSETADLAVNYPGERVWVRQTGSFAKSRASVIGALD